MSDRGDDVRVLLEDASGSGRERDIRPEDTWSRGRRRQSRKRAGAGVVGALGVAAVVGLVWQTNLLGGGQETGVATPPSGLTTFVLAAPGAPGQVPNTLDGLAVPAPEDLVGTTWRVREDLWGSDLTAVDVVGSAAETDFSFGGNGTVGWGFWADGCGGGWFQEALEVTEDGAFSGGPMGTDDQGCLEPAQTAEDFWIDVLGHGGSLHQLGEDWLLLSVDPSWAGLEEPPPVVVDGAARLDFVREGADPATIDTASPERVPANEELTGTWQLLEWADGGGVLGDFMADPSQLRLSFEGMPPQSLLLSDGPPSADGDQTCPIVSLGNVQGVDSLGHTVPPDHGYTLTPADGTCASVADVQPVFVDGLREGAQITLVGEDLLVLRLPLVERGTVQESGDVTDPTSDQVTDDPDLPDGIPDVTFVQPGTELAWPDADTWSHLSERGGALVSGVRFGAHDGFDRVVIDLETAEQPGWMVRYEDPPGGQAFDPPELPGDATLVVDVVGVPYPADSEQPTSVPVGETNGLSVVTGAVVAGPYEAHLNFFVGVDHERPFSVTYLEDPGRLVIDIQH